MNDVRSGSLLLIFFKMIIRNLSILSLITHSILFKIYILYVHAKVYPTYGFEILALRRPLNRHEF